MMHQEKNYEILFRFKYMHIFSKNDAESIEYSKIRSDLEKRGEVIDPNDIIVAATVKANNGILVTNNMKEFERVKNLRLEDWS